MGCDGDEACLIHGDYENEYIKNEECKYNCEPVKCPNYIVCGNIRPARNFRNSQYWHLFAFS